MEACFNRIEEGLQVLSMLRSTKLGLTSDSGLDTSLHTDINSNMDTGLDGNIGNIDEVFAFHIVGDRKDDLDILLALLSPSNISAEHLWNAVGLKIKEWYRSL